MTINIDGRVIKRVFAIVAATLGVGAAAFFGGQATRMNDDAVASQKQVAVTIAVGKVRADAKVHERHAVRKAIRKTRTKTRTTERKRATRLSDQARNNGYASGNSAGYSSGHSAGESEGINKASDELVCSDDSDVALPSCSY
jgi:hypothetical protein